MQDFANKKILIGITGGIAAYKTAYLVRELISLGAQVRIVMTQSALAFVTPMTFQALSGNEVRIEVFDSSAERAMGHIELARWADFLVIAPASANCLAKLAHGFADDLLSTLFLVTEAPVLVCPAMNRSMWAHPATVANVQTLVERGVRLVGPEEGSQACGEEGLGRMSEVASIINALRLAAVPQCLSEYSIMITAGPSREMIDPVRYLSNRSSGKMGYALAQAAAAAGAKVTLISGPSALTPPCGVTFVAVETAQQMQNAVMEQLKHGMIFIGAAAVADYRVQAPRLEKIKRQGCESMTLALEATPDILAGVIASGKALYTVGFAAETETMQKHAQEKLARKRVDMMIGNIVGENQGFEVEENQVTIMTADETLDLPLNHKVRLAGQIIEILAGKISGLSLNTDRHTLLTPSRLSPGFSNLPMSMELSETNRKI